MKPFLFPFASLTALTCCGSALADADFMIAGRPYRLVTTERTWAAAEADAVAKGGHLVRIESQEENDALLAALADKNVTSTASNGAICVWTGGKESAEGTYAWLDAAQPFWTGGKTGASAAGAYTNWGRGTVGSTGPEPDNGGGAQNRVAFGLQAWPTTGATKVGQPGQWNDVRDTDTLFYVIEFDGLFATFAMSHGGAAKGSFTAKLFFDKAPLTVANFVGLAEGTRPFVDEAKGGVGMRPYFNGLLCHRIIKDFMIQGGDPRGTGTGGPGYAIPDEFDPSLRHNKAGMLSMANSGPVSGGSQFFITVAAAGHLDDKHAIFGEVISGYNEVVLPLSKVETNTGDRPKQDVKIDSITFTRVGAAAEAFRPETNTTLPAMSMAPAAASLSAEKHCLLTYDRVPNSEYRLLLSGDATAWTLPNGKLSMERAAPSTDPADTFSWLPTTLPARQFFRVVELTYPPIQSPSSVSSLKITASGEGSSGNFLIGTGKTGTHTANAGGDLPFSGDITDLYWEPSPYGGRLILAVTAKNSQGQNLNVNRFDFGLRFTSPTGGTFRGIMQSATIFGTTDLLNYGGAFSTAPNP